MPQNNTASLAPLIPDYELVRCIGKGSYGEVWLARSATGNYRAVKIIYRAAFKDARPFEREFFGVQHFEPISRMHPGLVAILHVGKNESAGHFHYVMEVADDAAQGVRIDAGRYVPKTLSQILGEKRRLPVEQAAELGVALTAALGFLHSRGLVHRDIKPSNIIFVNGAPKFADVGLVAEIGKNDSDVGTEGYIPPERSGSVEADLFSLGKVLYQVGTGRPVEDVSPHLPSSLEETTDIPSLFRFNEVIMKATDPDLRQRYHAAEEMGQALRAVLEKRCPLEERATVHITRSKGKVTEDSGGGAGAKTQMPSGILSGLRVALLYKANVAADGRVLQRLQQELARAGADVFYDKHLAIGVAWAREIEGRIRCADAAVVLLSETSVQSEMITYEVEIAHQSAQQQHGKPRLLPVRVQFEGLLPSPLARVLDPLHYFLWQGPQDDEKLVAELIRALETSPPSPSTHQPLKLESIGGAVPLESQFYVVRQTDHEFQSAVARQDSIVLVKGARQMGKTSLLARGLQQAREAGARVAFADFQKLNASHLASVEAFYLTLGEFLTDQLELTKVPEDVWDKRRSPNINFERFLRREVLDKLSGHFLWGLDEVDRLFTCNFGGEVFGLFRSWHNVRALDPRGPWSRLTLAIAYATEAHLFISDVNQSPFNVGTRLTLDDFDLKQVGDLNQRYGSPLQTASEVEQFFRLLGGQPYLVRRGLNELASGNVGFDEFKANADRNEGVFGDHLRRILVLLAQDHELFEIVRGILRGQPCPSSASFYRLRSAGLMRGDSAEDARPRCEIYASYLRRHLR